MISTIKGTIKVYDIISSNIKDFVMFCLSIFNYNQYVLSRIAFFLSFAEYSITSSNSISIEEYIEKTVVLILITPMPALIK